MQYNLLDTHTFIWYVNGAAELPQKVRSIIEAQGAVNFVSIASLWEIAIKLSLSKLELKVPFQEIGIQIERNGFEILPITIQDTLTLATLPFHHRDPFDRMIVAQGLTSNLNIISKDKSFELYDATVIW